MKKKLRLFTLVLVMLVLLCTSVLLQEEPRAGMDKPEQPADREPPLEEVEHRHEFGGWMTEVEASCGQAGILVRVCDDCGEKERREVPATGVHTEVLDVAIAPTCTKDGLTAGKHCSACGAVTVAQTVVPSPGHMEVVTPKKVLPTCDRSGLSEGRGCSVCYETTFAQQEIPARGYDWMLEDGEFKILMIGNSYTEDASNCGQGVEDSQLYSILRAMLGENVKVTVGVITMGGKGLNWHASRARAGDAVYTLRMISTAAPSWKNVQKVSVAGAMAWAEWDVISLQPYAVDSATGIELCPYPEETDADFAHLSDTAAYMLDLAYSNAPQAEVYCYMHWSQVTATVQNAGLPDFERMAAFYPAVLTYSGTESGKRFTSLVPVGLSVQNARSTYLACLSYHPTAYIDGNLTYETDAQIGLQRDSIHLSFNVGRYIAALTFAETLVPASLRAENYQLPPIRTTESVGMLPNEYTEIAQKAVMAALASWRAGSLAVTAIEGYEVDPTAALAGIMPQELLIRYRPDTQAMANEIAELVRGYAADGLVVEKVGVPDYILPGVRFDATVAVRFGYTTRSFALGVLAAE